MRSGFYNLGFQKIIFILEMFFRNTCRISIRVLSEPQVFGCFGVAFCIGGVFLSVTINYACHWKSHL